MTTPSERTRAVLETRRFLSQLAEGSLTNSSQEYLKRAAEALLRHYPDASHLAHSAQATPLFWADPDAPRP
ncbi:BPSL0761 family protein [Variovorax sp. GT1P44]|uniref:BPSL0761 family protein n=1 Tax=Variovorax sp. GT1P44 TaxID=3443742 RepID=UPI003F485223